MAWSARRFREHARDPVYGNGVALVLNSVVGSLLGFAFWMLAARRFAAADVGWGAAVVSAATLAALVGKAGFDAAVVRYAPSLEGEPLRRLVARALVASVLVTAAVSAVLLALAGRGVATLGPLFAPAPAALFLLLACGTAAMWILDALFIAEQVAVWTLARNVAFNLVKLVGPIALAAAAGFAVPLAWALGLAASVAVALFVLPRILRRATAAPGAVPTAREVAGYAAKNYALNVSEFLPGLVLPVLVLAALGAEVNARFYLAWTLASVGFLASKAVAQSAFAQLVREGDARAPLAKGALLSLVTLAPFGLGLLVFPDVVMRLFGYPSTPDVAWMLRFLAVSLVPLSLANLYLAYLKARRAGLELTLIPAASLAALLAALPFALATAGLGGVGAAWLAVQCVVGAYAAARLFPILLVRSRRRSHGNPQPRTPIANASAGFGRRAHQG